MISSQRDEQRLLLVAAGEAADADAGARDPDRERLDGVLRAPFAGGEVENAALAGVAPDHAEVDVLEHRHVEEQALALAVLGQVGDAGIERVLRRVDVTGWPSSSTSPPALGSAP